MKGMIQEMFYLIIIIIVILMLFVFFTYERGTKGVEVKKDVEERILDEGINGLAGTMFNSKLPYAEKFYLEAAIDAILEAEYYKRNDSNKVFYGVGMGQINVTEVIPPLLDLYSKGRLKVIIETPDKKYSYGDVKEGDVIYSYESWIPVPEERIGKITILMG